jgi:hypothetical protein
MCLPKVPVYIGNRRELQKNKSVPIGLLTEKSETIGVQLNLPVSIGSLTVE